MLLYFPFQSMHTMTLKKLPELYILFVNPFCRGLRSRARFKRDETSRPETRPGSSQSRMPVLSRDREEDVPKCSGREISRIFSGKIRFPEMAFGNADFYPFVFFFLLT